MSCKVASFHFPAQTSLPWCPGPPGRPAVYKAEQGGVYQQCGVRRPAELSAQLSTAAAQPLSVGQPAGGGQESARWCSNIHRQTVWIEFLLGVQGSSSMQVSHRLCVQCPGLGQGESIAVTGSGAELGNWRKKAVQVLVQDSQDRFGRFYRTKIF